MQIRGARGLAYVSIDEVLRGAAVHGSSSRLQERCWMIEKTLSLDEMKSCHAACGCIDRLQALIDKLEAAKIPDVGSK